MKLFLLSLTFILCNQLYAQDSLVKAQSLYTNKEYLEAKSILVPFISNHSNNYQAQLLLGKIYGQLGEWEQASNQFKKLKTSHTNVADLYYFYGAAVAMQAKTGSKLKALGKLSDIESSFNKAIELNPNHIEAHWALVTYYNELPGILGGSFSKAKQYANHLLQISPVDGYLALGYLYEYDKDYTNAENNYIKAHKIGYSKTTFQKLYHLYLNKLKNPDKANRLKQQFKSN